MRLHHRLMLILCGVSGLILGISLIVVHELVIRDELASLDRALLVAAHNAAHQYDRARGETALGGVVTLPEALAPTPSLIAVYDNSGALVRSSASFDGGAPDLSELGLGLDEPVPWEGAAAELTHDGTPLRGVVVPLHESGVLLYAASTSMVSEDRRFLLHSLPILFLLAMAVTATISRAVGRLLARDVERLAEAVGEIGRGNLDARVRHSVGGSRETAALAHGLDATAAQLKSLIESQRRFITDAAHELRSPLATLRGELQLALRRRRSEDEYREALTAAVEDVEELSELADELLALAKPRDLERSRGRVDVDAIVRAAIRLAEGGASLGGVDLRRRGEPEAYRAELCGHRPTLVRCLRNVIDNAIQHGASGGVVTICATERGAWIELAVEDHGPGIDPADAERVFEPFFRSRHARARADGGAGLGLALALRGVREHGGELIVDTTFTGGARFVISLPRAPDGASPRRRTVRRTPGYDRQPSKS